ncbi:MAG: FHA domain-containing protein [Acidobacteria bacterium]|nr:FHA domain-containing protein [Acidobacteriota bacterium]
MVKRLLVKKGKNLLPELATDIPANGIITVGNDSSATIELPAEFIAPEQFVIVCEDDSMTLLCRVDGTIVNGEILMQGALHKLQSGDEIILGEYTLFPENGNGNGRAPIEPKTPPTAEPPLPLFDAPAPAEPLPEKTDRSLNDVLEGLRAEEKFYFLIRDADLGEQRVYVENEEMWIGWSAGDECVITTDPAAVEIPRGQIRKDWSGVVLYPLQNGFVWLNEETLTEPRRLKNDDKLFLLSKDNPKLRLETAVRFHEPTALLILDSILPKELPPPILLDGTATEAGGRELDETDLIHTSKTPPPVVANGPKRRIFGYFSLFEIVIMAIGTLITAAVIFLILEWY